MQGMAKPEAQINLTNQFLIAMPCMADPTFAGSVVCVCEHNERGALGTVINRPIDIDMGTLFDKIDLARDPAGRQSARLFRRAGADRAWLRAARPGRPLCLFADRARWLEMTTSKDVLEAVANGDGPRRFLLTLGYSGWGAGQLEEELSRNGWLTVHLIPKSSSAFLPRNASPPPSACWAST